MQVVDVNGNMFGYDYLEIIGINGKPKTIGGGGSGTVTSVGLSMPSAFSVTNSPVTTSGTIAVSGAGVASQYIRGDGSLANFPTSTGGGASVSYYLNGSISQGTIGGVAYKEINSVPVIGSGTDFTINADGYIAQFITDVGDPNKLLIPAGNWNFETYFSASSGGGSPRFYIELYKYNGTTFTLIASNSATPENITGGTSIDLYFTALAVPATTLLATDRLAVRFYVIHSGRTITMHTENSHLSQIITTFSTGLTALNGLSSQVQYLAVGTTGTDFNISSATDTHTFNLPTASATNRGALSSADWGTFNGKQNAITLTTTGTSGPATLVGTTLNVPQYSSGGGGTFGTHIVVKPKSGVYYSSNPLSGSGGTTTATANFYYLAPFIPQNTLVINEMRVEVNTIAAGGLATMLIFDDLNGLPKNKLLESTNLDCSTSGMKTFTTSYTFTAGTTYWLGVSVNANIGFRSNNTSFALQHHASSSAVNVQYFKAATFGSVPSSITISPNSDASALQPVTIRFRQV